MKVATIRLYESIGLLPRPARSQTNYRRYSDDAVDRLRFIGRSQSLGFEIEDIHQLLALSHRPSSTCQEVAVLATRHLADIERRLATLKQAKADFVRMIRQHAR